MHRCVALICKGIIQPGFICQGAAGQVQPEESLEHCCWLLFAVRGILTWVLEQVGLWDDPVEVILWFFKGSLSWMLDRGFWFFKGSLCWMLRRGFWAMAGAGVTG